MANYALITGIDIELQSSGWLAGSAYKNTIGIHRFLSSIGYTSIQLLCPNLFELAVSTELRNISKKLKKGDKFLFYYFGHAIYTHEVQYILFKHSETFDINPTLDINSIKSHTNIPGVDRMILLDTYCLARKKEGVIGENGINKTLVEKTITHTHSDSPKETSPHFPIGCYWDHNEYLSPEGESLFLKAILESFTQCANNGLEISFPAICESILEIYKEQGAKNILPGTSGRSPCYTGDRVVLLSPKKGSASHSSRLSEKKNQAKIKADQLLDKILNEHEEWLTNNDMVRKMKFFTAPPFDHCDLRLTWTKLKPVLAMYERAKLNPPTITNRNLSFANFDFAWIISGVSFSGSIFDGSSFINAKLDNVDFSNSSMDRCNLEHLEAVQCDFSNSHFYRSVFDSSKLIDCNFKNTAIVRSELRHSVLTFSSFLNAFLSSSSLHYSSACKADFTNTNLSGCILNRANFSHSQLTGATLYGTARADWCIEGVECQYVYWDKGGKERFPPDNDFEEGEFTTLYRDYPKFSYTFKEGFTPLDLILATHIVDQINAADVGFTIKIDNASVRGLNPTLNFIMETGDDKKADAQELFKQEYEKQIQKLKKKLQKTNEQLLAERGARADFAEKHLEISTEHQQIMNQFFTPLLTELLQRKDPPNRKRLGHREPERSNGEIQKVILCDKLLTVQVGENEPVAFGSVKQYAVFKAVIQASKIQNQRVDLEQIAEIAGEIEKALAPAKEKKRRGWEAINKANEVSGICHDLREYCEENEQLGFLKPLVLQAYTKSVPLAGYEIEEVESISAGRPISNY